MRIKILLNLGAGLPDYEQDQVVTEDEAVAKKLIRMGVAKEIPPVRVKSEKTQEKKQEQKQKSETSAKPTEFKIGGSYGSQ